MKSILLPRTLTLVRHGESEGNIIKSTQDNNKTSATSESFSGVHTLYFRLTEKGVNQAKQAGAWLQDYFRSEAVRRGETSFALVRGLISPYYRTRETAGHLNLPVVWSMDHRLSERNWGALELMTKEERRERFGEVFDSWNEHGLYWKMGGIESLQSLSLRLSDHFRDLEEYSNQDVVQVSHGETILIQRFLLEDWLPEELSEMMRRTSMCMKCTPDTDWQNKIINCRVVQYTREREDGSWAGYYVRVRMIDPANPTSDKTSTDWKPIVHRGFTNEDLLSNVEKVPYMLR